MSKEDSCSEDCHSIKVDKVDEGYDVTASAVSFIFIVINEFYVIVYFYMFFYFSVMTNLVVNFIEK